MDEQFNTSPDYGGGGDYAQPAEQPNWTQAATQNPPPPPRWGSAEEMRYARKSAGLRQVLDDLDEGAVHPQYAQPLVEQYHAELGALDQQRQAASAIQEQQATQKALGAAAMQRAVLAQNQSHDADQFLGLMRHYHNPVTGESAAFYQKEPGKWEQVQGAPAPGGDSTVPDGTVGEADLSVGDQGGATPGEADAPVGDQQPAGPQRHEMTITNGPYAEKVQYENGQIVSRSPVTFSDGKPVPAQTAKEADNWGLTPDRLRMIDRQAAVQAMHMPPGRSRDALISHVRQRLIGAAIQEDFATKRQAAQADVAAKAEAGKEKRAADAEVGKGRAKSLESATNRVHEQYMAAVSAHAKDPTQAIPEEIATPQARVELAHQLHMEHWAAQHPDDPEVKKWLADQSAGLGELLGRGPKSVKHLNPKTGEELPARPQTPAKGKAAAQPAAKPATAVAPKPGDATLAQLLAEKQRRQAGRNQPPAPNGPEPAGDWNTGLLGGP